MICSSFRFRLIVIRTGTAGGPGLRLFPASPRASSSSSWTRENAPQAGRDRGTRRRVAGTARVTRAGGRHWQACRYRQAPEGTGEGTVDHHASLTHAHPGLQEITIRWRGSFGYMDAWAGKGDDDDERIPLCRIEYLGDDDWAFAIYDPATENLRRRDPEQRPVHRHPGRRIRHRRHRPPHRIRTVTSKATATRKGLLSGCTSPCVVAAHPPAIRAAGDRTVSVDTTLRAGHQATSSAWSSSCRTYSRSASRVMKRMLPSLTDRIRRLASVRKASRGRYRASEQLL